MIKKFGQRLKNEKGLTLIELLAVIVILGIIAAIAIPSIAGIIEKAREDAIKADAIQVINAGKLYIAGNGIPDGTDPTIDDDMLKSFLDNVTLKDYSVSIDTTKNNQLSVSGTGTKGSVKIEFTKATIEDINNSGKGARAIPAATK